MATIEHVNTVQLDIRFSSNWSFQAQHTNYF